MKLRCIIRIAVYSLLGGVVLIVIAMLLAWRNTPRWYRPARLNTAQLQRASADLNAQVSRLVNDANYDPPNQPIVVELSQARLNGFIQALPLYGAKLPGGLSDPMIVLRKDRLILAGRFLKFGQRPVSLHLAMRIDSDRVAVEIESVDVGSLPLPRQFVQDQLGELRHRLEAAGESAKRVGKPGRRQSELVQFGQAFFAAVEGNPMPREFRTPTVERRIRLDRLELSEGALKLTFVPLGPARDRAELIGPTIE